MREIPEVTDVEVAFSADAEKYMPEMSEIPKEFKRSRGTKESRLFSDIFFSGVEKLKFVPREGVDADKAWRVLRLIAGSFAPAHEHKDAAWSYLVHEWFEDVAWTNSKTGERTELEEGHDAG